MRIKTRRIDSLTLDPENARKHTDEDIEATKRSIERFGQQTPIVITNDGVVIKGNGTTMAMMALGKTEIKTVTSNLSSKEVRAYAIADNKTGMLAEWDWTRLAEQIQDLEEEARDAIGFTETEIADLLGKMEDDLDIEPEPEDEVPAVPKKPKSKLGQIYQLGRHRLLVGDCLAEDSVDKLFDGKLARCCVTDPPYNVDYEGTAGKVENDDLGDEFEPWILEVMLAIEARLEPGSGVYVCHSDTYGHMFRNAFVGSGLLLKQCLIWEKQSLVLGRQDYHWRHEPILYGWKAGARHRWYGNRKRDTIILDESQGLAIEELEDCYRVTCSVNGVTTVLNVPSYEVVSHDEEETVWKIKRPTKSLEHPTMKPLDLMQRAIRNSSKKDDIVFDPFGGSGSTLIACEQLGRCCYTCEIDPGYADVIIGRYEKFTGAKAKKLK